MLYLTTSQSLEALNAATGKPVWSTNIISDQTFSGANFFDGKIYATSSSGCFNCEIQPYSSTIYAFSATTGKLLWESVPIAGYPTEPTEAHGIVCVGTAYFLATDNPDTTPTHLFGFDAATGRQRWSYTFAPNQYDGYQSIVPGNNLLFISPNNDLIDTLQASDGKLVQSYSIAISGYFLTLTLAP